MISLIIPTYKEPEVLDICLQSAINHQSVKNQIIVVVDGTYDINKHVLKKYKNDIDILNLKENKGLCKATNLGVYNAKHDIIFVINDDNVLSADWDKKLINEYKPRTVITPNQIEPRPSMFKQFHIKDLGTDPKSFNIEAFVEYEKQISTETSELTGSTLPFLMSKQDYISVGGWDESYPGPWVVDWEFFMKCEMNNMSMIRTYNTHVYHFGSLATQSPDKHIKENACREYFKYKWGFYPAHNPETNSKLP